jgi:hypothetical protein
LLLDLCPNRLGVKEAVTYLSADRGNTGAS